ncbi:hypothetical protein PSTG_10709 [Puccinia striiformis f. sp. tritici PST-78]|uniref:Uncharacterized protein n=1 Tax=Puccinia striiformis f. sp. tritici PST-78 TaxID=1165861 RepID=A0A0L0V9R5_9BASI|nr:hypothetical protein PSTG_10709 [Puccinia striiformis f. sp. tritici PST-78]
MHATGASLESSTSPTSGSLWRLHSYLDSIECCHFCKKTRVSEPGACQGQIDKDYTNIPASFVAPPKPPKPWGPPPSNTGVEELPNQFTYDLAAVDAVQAVGLELPKDKDDSTLYPRLSSAAIATYRELGALDASVQDVAFNNTDPRLEE